MVGDADYSGIADDPCVDGDAAHLGDEEDDKHNLSNLRDNTFVCFTMKTLSKYLPKWTVA